MYGGMIDVSLLSYVHDSNLNFVINLRYGNSIK
jgi:hypothetical protein